MATFTAKVYGKFFNALANKEIDLIGTPDTLKIALTTSSYTPDQDAHDYFDDVTNELAASGGYTAGGFTLDSVTFSYTAGSNLWTLDAADEVVSSTTLTWRTAVIYDSSPGSAGTNPLICYQQGDGDTVTTAGTLTLQFNASGIVTITIS